MQLYLGKLTFKVDLKNKNRFEVTLGTLTVNNVPVQSSFS